MKRNAWFYVALGAICVSIISLFMPVIVYSEGFTPPFYAGILGRGVVSVPDGAFFGTYTIVDLIGTDRFVREVLVWYRGTVSWYIDTPQVAAMAALAFAALVISFIGIITMRSQYQRTWQYVLTLVGLVGTTFPSLMVFYAVGQSRKGFTGVIQCGIAPYLMPIAAVVSIVAVVYRRTTVQKEILQRARSQNLIWAAGDLTGNRMGGGSTADYDSQKTGRSGRGQRSLSPQNQKVRR